jgi:proteasome accessory factor A
MPPRDTRAWVRGRAVAQVPALVKASWTSLVVDDPAGGKLVRRPIPEAVGVEEDLARRVEGGDVLAT